MTASNGNGAQSTYVVVTHGAWHCPGCQTSSACTSRERGGEITHETVCISCGHVEVSY